jgi:hypothetical protein
MGKFKRLLYVVRKTSHKILTKNVNPCGVETFKETMETFVILKVSIVLSPLWNNWNK